MSAGGRRIAAGAFALALGLAGCTAPGDRDLAGTDRCVPVATDAATATLRMPPLAGLPRQVCLGAPRHRLYVQEVSVWPGEGGGPRAALSVQRLAPGYHFLLERDLRQQTAALDVAGGAVRFGSVTAARNGLGTVRYLPFHAGGQACVSFSQYWGNTDMETTVSVGRARAFGYYCDAGSAAPPAGHIAAALVVNPERASSAPATAAAPAISDRAADAGDAFMRVAVQSPRRTGHF